MPPPSIVPRGVNLGREGPSQMWMSVRCWGNLNKYFVNVSSIPFSASRKTQFCSHFSMSHTLRFIVLGMDDALVKSDLPCYSSPLFFSLSPSCFSPLSFSLHVISHLIPFLFVLFSLPVHPYPILQPLTPWPENGQVK